MIPCFEIVSSVWLMIYVNFKFKLLILISNMGNFKFEDQCLISLLQVSLQGMTTMGYRSGIKLTRKSPSQNLQHF